MRSVCIGLGVAIALGSAQVSLAESLIDAVRADMWPVPLTAPSGDAAVYTPLSEGLEWRGHVMVLKAHDDGATTLPNGGQEIYSFFDIFTELTLPDSSTTLLRGLGRARFLQIPGTDTFDTEMLTLDHVGSGPLMIRESPTRASLGRTSVLPDGAGYRIDSFFDIFTELSVDGGQTWVPSVASSSPLHVQTPEPSTLALLGAGVIGWAILRWRRHRPTRADG